MRWQKCGRHFAQEIELSPRWRRSVYKTDESKDILKSVLNEDKSTDSDGDVDEL